jgi:Transposase DDE domain
VRLLGTRLMKPIAPLLARLHTAHTDRDRAGNRQLFFDQYASLLLVYFFTPALESLRALQHATNWKQTERKLGLGRTSLGSLSEASRVFDAELLREVVQELARQALPFSRGQEAEALQGLTAVDGSLFRGVSQMAWALWQDEEHRALKLHLHLDVFKNVPVDATVSPGKGSEPAQLAQALEPDRLYVIDGGYFQYELLARILAANSSFVARVQPQIAHEVEEVRELSPAARQAGVTRDVVLSAVGGKHRLQILQPPVRLVVVDTVDRQGRPLQLFLLTNRLDLPAELVALAYRHRWSIELFFRWMKSVLKARHLIARSANGVALQMYAALIVSLLLVLYTGRKPNRRLFETIQFYLLGWVSDDELDAALARLPQVALETNP